MNVTEMLNQYGYIVLVAALGLELIAAPLPGELLMGYCGYLVFKGTLGWVPSILTASCGAILGISTSYFIGKTLGLKFFLRYGHYVHITPKRLDTLSQWFERYGGKLLIVAYFIPGIRHVTGYFSGITKISYHRFAVSAYAGAVIWTSFFITLGKILGPDWEKFHVYIKKYMLIGGIILAIILITLYLYRSHKSKVDAFIVTSLKNTLTAYQSMGRLKLSISVVAFLCLGSFIWVIGLIQDYMAHEFNQFDIIVGRIVFLLFDDLPPAFFRSTENLFLPAAFVITFIFLLYWIKSKSRQKLLELRFIALSLVGGCMLNTLLRLVFHRQGPISAYTFPEFQSFMAVLLFGFTAYLVHRYTSKKHLQSLVFTAATLLCLLTGAVEIFLSQAYPSDVGAGFVFGGFWLSLNLILLEIFRILPDIKD